ncbi:MAG: tagaturonate epimerase family protein, partial [Kiritimatiellia bacterium]
MLELPPFSMGIGDRFGQQGKAQLQAFVLAKERGIEVAPVWNKSFREHSLVGTVPADVRREADAAVCALNWNGPYFVDADHIGLPNVDSFIEASD